MAVSGHIEDLANRNGLKSISIDGSALKELTFAGHSWAMLAETKARIA